MVCRLFQFWSKTISQSNYVEDNLPFISDSDDTLGGRLVSAREASNLTTAQVARRIGVEAETMGLWENDRDEPRPNKLVTLAGVLNVSPTWLLSGAGESPTEQSIITEMVTIRATIERLRETMMGVTDELESLEQRLASYRIYRN